MENDTQDNETVDRAIPSVAVHSKSHIAFMAALLVFALLAMIYVIIDGRESHAQLPLTQNEEITFRSPAGLDAPYIQEDETNDKETPVPAKNPEDDREKIRQEKFLQEEALRIAREQQQKRKERIHSAQLIFDQPVSTTAIDHASNMRAAPDHTGFQAVRLQNLHALISQGTMISGILETAIQSDLPGQIRAVVSEDVYSFDASTLLVPKGSRLLGEYRSGLVRGQSRIFVIWNRLLRNDGTSIDLNSAGTDSLGRAGLGGQVDTHFFERFGSSVLLSMIDSGLKAGVQSLDNNRTSTVALQTGNDFSKAAEIALENSIAIPPTLHVDQGTRIKVYVKQDLDFSTATTQR